jgi:hypothetical protein
MARTQVSGTPTGESGYKPTFERDQASANLIQGDRLKFSGNNVWTDAGGKPLNLDIRYVVTGARIGLQRWVKKDGKPVPEVILGTLPEIEKLNAAIPKETWETGLDGKPKAPWAFIWVFYLVNPVTAKKFTYVNSTSGTKIAYNDLVEQIFTARELRGEDVLPIVKLGTTPMKTQWGVRPRPAFEVEDYTLAGAGALAHKQAPAIEHKPVEEPAVENDFYDDGTGDL